MPTVVEYPKDLPVPDFAETSLYDCLGRMGELGARATVRAGEGYMRTMAEINGHRHALGQEPIKFEAVHPKDLPSPWWWQVEVNDKVMSLAPVW